MVAEIVAESAAAGGGEAADEVEAATDGVLTDEADASGGDEVVGDGDQT